MAGKHCFGVPEVLIGQVAAVRRLDFGIMQGGDHLAGFILDSDREQPGLRRTRIVDQEVDHYIFAIAILPAIEAGGHSQALSAQDQQLFARAVVVFLRFNNGVFRIGKKLKEMSFKELGIERQRLQAEGIDALPVSLELHRKLAFSFATLMFVAFGLSLGLSLHHHERLVIFVWVLGWSMAYYLATIGLNAIALKGWAPPWLAMWTPNFAGGAFAGLRLWHTLRR